MHIPGMRLLATESDLPSDAMLRFRPILMTTRGGRIVLLRHTACVRVRHEESELRRSRFEEWP